MALPVQRNSLVRVGTEVVVVMCLITGTVNAQSRDNKKKDRGHLSRSEIEAVVRPHTPALKKCYVKHGLSQKSAKGRMRIELLIRPIGVIKRITTHAPGVKGKRLQRCVTRVLRGARFPEKTFHTAANVPFLFVKTKGGGPIEGCREASGCRDHDKERK